MKTNQAKRIMSRVAAAGVTAAMVGATVMGGMAANLADLPAPFVQNGQADVTIVLGGNAAVDDMLGAIDIATALQAANVVSETVNVPGSGNQFTVSDGVLLAQSGNNLKLNSPALNVSKPRLTRSDLPSLLGDGEVRIQSNNRNYKFDQEIVFGGSNVQFNKNPSGMDDPMVYLNTDEDLWTYTLTFRGTPLDLTASQDSETIEMLGKAFTIDPNIEDGEEVVLYGTQNTQFLNLNTPVTMTHDGLPYEVEIVGGNSDGPTAVLLINGQQRTVQEGQTYTFGELEIYVRDLFVTNIPTLSVSATIFVGSQKVELPAGQDGQTNFGSLEINGQFVNGLTARVVGNNSAVQSISFQFNPGQLNDDVPGFDETRFLLAGDAAVDPLFDTVQVLFQGPNLDLDSDMKTMIDARASGRNVELRLTTDTGDQITFTPFYIKDEEYVLKFYEQTGTSRRGYAGPVNNGDIVNERQIFVINEGSSTSRQSVFYEVVGFKKDGTTELVRLRNMNSGTTSELKDGDFIGSSNVQVDNVDADDRFFEIDGTNNEPGRIYLNGGRNYVQFWKHPGTAQNPALPITNTFGNQTGNGNETVVMQLVESAGAKDELAQADTHVFTTFTIGGSNMNEPRVGLFNGASIVENSTGTPATVTSALSTGSGLHTDNGNNREYGLTRFGTYAIGDADSDKRFASLYVPNDRDQELKFSAFFAPIGATVGTGSAGGQVTTSQIVPINIGAAVLDRNVNVATASTNLIVIGGPRANSVANTLLGMPSQEDIDMMFPAGRAIVRLFELDTGKTAMLVAGHEAMETQAASRKVAQFDPALMGQEATMTVTSLNNVQITTSN
jgi:hypothetical protein